MRTDDSKFAGFPIGIRDSREEAQERKEAKRAEREDPAYLKKVRALPCCICGRRGGIEVHHWPKRSKAGRHHDHLVIPLCAKHHRTGPDAFHVLNLRRFENRHKVSIADLITRTQKACGLEADRG